MAQLRAWLLIVLLPLLLAAQHCALLHQAGHLLDGTSLPFTQHDESKSSVDSGLCDYHVAFAELLGAIDSSKPPLPLASNDAERGIARSFLPSANSVIRPSSRGPPVLL